MTPTFKRQDLLKSSGAVKSRDSKFLKSGPRGEWGFALIPIEAMYRESHARFLQLSSMAIHFFSDPAPPPAFPYHIKSFNKKTEPKPLPSPSEPKVPLSPTPAVVQVCISLSPPPFFPPDPHILAPRLPFEFYSLLVPSLSLRTKYQSV